MKRKIRTCHVFLLLVLLSACAVPGPEEPEFPEAMLALPGAVVNPGERIVEYPGESLFAAGAVLPLPGGMEILDPLIAFMLANPGLTGTGTVRSDGPDADYHRRLAQKRKELLTAVFRNRGLPAERLIITSEVGPGVPFDLKFQPFEGGSSETGNR